MPVTLKKIHIFTLIVKQQEEQKRPREERKNERKAFLQNQVHYKAQLVHRLRTLLFISFFLHWEQFSERPSLCSPSLES